MHRYRKQIDGPQSVGWGGKTCKGGQKVQTSNYEIYKS